ncbi:MAG: hypothetical protein R8K20_06345 [Gallionellaceae bacterium]
MSDEIITEARAIEDAIGAKFNYDLRAQFEDIKRGEAELKAARVKAIAPPLNPTAMRCSAFQRSHSARRQP